SATQINSLMNIDNRHEYSKYFYRDAITQQYSLNLSGGSKNMAWFISGSHNRSIGNLHEESDKTNVRIENIFKPIKGLNIRASVYYTNANRGGYTAPSFRSITVNGKFVPYL